MSETSVTPEVASMMHDIFAKQGALQALGASITKIGAGTCETRLPMSAAASQHHGFFHGGVIGTLGDATGGLTANSLLLPKHDCLAVEYKINFLAPAKGEALIGRGRVLRAGKTLVVTSIEIFSLDEGVEKLCAVMQQTVFAVEQK